MRGRLTKPGRRNRPRGGLEAAQRRHVCAHEAKGLRTFLLDQTGHRAVGERIAHMKTAIGGRTGPRDESVSRLYQAAVGLQRAGHAFAQPAHCVLGGRQGEKNAHSGVSSTGLLTICGRTAMSGGTPIMRSVCCTTSLNTGAAEIPP
ncbi:hypothetical protein SDC9_86826 [bioreactor metagenome]|uniref:Uncharacterized protein n=1 Tax=bioreactor metagenome TaxID=1076179 RepID=A0A644ZH66_9ZZZZ